MPATGALSVGRGRDDECVKHERCERVSDQRTELTVRDRVSCDRVRGVRHSRDERRQHGAEQRERERGAEREQQHQDTGEL